MSDNLIIDTSINGNSISFIGDVKFSNGVGTIESDRIKLFFNSNLLKNKKNLLFSKLIATGNIKIFYKSLIAFAKKIICIKEKNIFLLTNVDLLFNKYQVKINKLIYSKNYDKIFAYEVKNG